MKTFLVEMDETKYHCDFCSDDICIHNNTYEHECAGDLNNRPEWCPLKEIKYVPAKKHDFDGRIWVEVEPKWGEE